MRNPQFYVSGKRPMTTTEHKSDLAHTQDSISRPQKASHSVLWEFGRVTALHYIFLNTDVHFRELHWSMDAVLDVITPGLLSLTERHRPKCLMMVSIHVKFNNTNLSVLAIRLSQTWIRILLHWGSCLLDIITVFEISNSRQWSRSMPWQLIKFMKRIIFILAHWCIHGLD